MKVSTITLVFLILILAGCEQKDKNYDFVIPDAKPAMAITIGWYVQPEIVKEIVGADVTPKIVNERNETSIMLFIVKSADHVVDGYASGPMEAAHLVIPVEEPGGFEINDGMNIENHIVCPITIIDQSQRLGNKYDDFGFPTYSGQIDMDIRNTGEKYMIEVTVKTINGLIELTGMFEEEAVESEISSAIITTKPGLKGYFFGKEKFKRISNGKGNLKTEGQNIISAMNLDKQQYYLKLDLDFTWQFDFASE